MEASEHLSPHFLGTLSPGIRDLWQSGEFQDVSLRVGDQEAGLASRLVLASLSPMLREAFLASDDSDAILFHQDDVRPEVLRRFLEAVLSGEEEESWTEEQQEAITEVVALLYCLKSFEYERGPLASVKKTPRAASSEAAVPPPKSVLECPLCFKEYRNELSYEKHLRAHKERVGRQEAMHRSKLSRNECKTIIWLNCSRKN